MNGTTPLSAQAQGGFHIFTTFRLDNTLLSDDDHKKACAGSSSDVYLLPYHYHRLKNAAAVMSNFNIPDSLLNLAAFERHIHFKRHALNHLNLNSGLQLDGRGSDVQRGKFSLWRDGRTEVSLVPVGQTFPLLFPKSFDDYEEPTWNVMLDTQPTETDLYTTLKTSHRVAYDRPRQAAGLTPSDTTEIILYNELDEVIDGTIMTVYFFRDNKWVTPKRGGLESTTQKYALDHGLCTRANHAVTKDSLIPGEVVWLSNAFRGFFPATFKVR